VFSFLEMQDFDIQCPAAMECCQVYFYPCLCANFRVCVQPKKTPSSTLILNCLVKRIRGRQCNSLNVFPVLSFCIPEGCLIWSDLGNTYTISVNLQFSGLSPFWSGSYVGLTVQAIKMWDHYGWNTIQSNTMVFLMW
jgi:hypothetical protein